MRALIRRQPPVAPAAPAPPATPTRRHRWRSLWNGRDRHLQELADVGFLADCTPQQRERIASLTTTLDVSAGRRLCRAGGSDRQFLVIVEAKQPSPSMAPTSPPWDQDAVSERSPCSRPKAGGAPQSLQRRP